MQRTTAQNRGQLGENIARRFLVARGYQFLQANFRWYGGEVDLIMKHGEAIIFVEVKLRTNGAYLPHEAVHQHKKFRLIRTCEVYLKKHCLYERIPFRIDVVEIILEGTRAKVRHFEDAVMRDT